MNMRIAVADDDLELRTHLETLLQSAGHSVDTMVDGKHAMTALRRETYDVALVDWNMPGSTGLEIVSWVSEELESPPVMILLTSRSAPGEIVRGLNAGASDYIVKPESDAVILARIDAAARKIAPQRSEPKSEQFGDFTFHNQALEIEYDGTPIKVTGKEFKLARLLFRNLNRPLSRAYIFNQVWGGSPDIETRTLDMHMSRVRSKLDLRPQNGFTIQTVFGFGYRMDEHGDESGED